MKEETSQHVFVSSVIIVFMRFHSPLGSRASHYNEARSADYDFSIIPTLQHVTFFFKKNRASQKNSKTIAIKLAAKM